MNQREAAVEYVLSDSTSLGALVLLPQGSPVYVPLTSTNELWIAMTGMADMDSHQKADAMYIQNQLHLYEKLWKPIETILQDVKAVYFSPTGFLNDLAFSAFICTDGSYLSDKYELHQMLSTGDLIDLRTSREKNVVRTASLYGSVFYSPEQEKEVESIAEDKSKKNRGALVDAFEYLPFTKQEVVDVGSLMNSKQVRVNIFEGYSSTEESVRSISEHSPDVLHFSTHGFFVKGDKNAMGNKFLARFPAMRFSSMQRSGLALVGANRTWEGAIDIPEESDGIITANEVALLDLSQTRLAVLSACQTAVGEYTTEGVYGMHRGFKQAGVKSILASLWNVNDKSTARLMALFYEKWLSGTPMQQSLNEAVRELRKEYPSPFYWAPFVLMDAEN
jgi:CHAT domain-containing protein